MRNSGAIVGSWDVMVGDVQIVRRVTGNHVVTVGREGEINSQYDEKSV